MKKIILGFFIVFNTISCNTDSVAELEKPSVFLEKPKMIQVIVDLQLLESYYHNKYQRPELYANALDSSSKYVFEKHAINKTIFNENLKFYTEQEDTLFALYEAVLDTVNNRINQNK